MPRRVVVALDDSIRAAGVLAAGADLAGALKADLYLVRALTAPAELSAAGGFSPVGPLAARLSAEATKDLFDLANRTHTAIVTEIIVKFGPAARTIVETAERLDANVIVLGSHGYRGWDSVLGTTAVSVANLAMRDVLIVHDRAARL
jgi:nucleotide-binding universal stress UspA family protein